MSFIKTIDPAALLIDNPALPKGYIRDMLEVPSWNHPSFIAKLEDRADLCVAKDLHCIAVSGKECDDVARKYGLPVGGGKNAAMHTLVPTGESVIVFDIDEYEASHPDVLVAHELIHHEQWLRGDLTYTANTTVWKGEEFDPVKYREIMAEPANTTIRSQLLNFPWEREAYLGSFPRDCVWTSRFLEIGISEETWSDILRMEGVSSVAEYQSLRHDREIERIEADIERIRKNVRETRRRILGE
jgi:hypothetical protein